jgi:methanogenic corrinoid protein MtbC1
MNAESNARPSFDFDDFRHSGTEPGSTQLESLAARLPQEAVQSLANEVILRLSANLNRAGADTAPAPEPVDALCRALLSRDADAGTAVIARLQADGVPIDEIYTVYLAAAARRMGEKWESDEISFTDVTSAASRILAILRALRDPFRSTRPFSDRSALFLAVPDEQHTIGVTMAADLFRREGWDVDLMIGASHDDVIDRVGTSDALVVGLTAHGRQSLAALIRLILAIRVVNPAVNVLVCGHIVEEADDVIALIGADGYASDIPTALLKMQDLHDAVRRPASPASSGG